MFAILKREINSFFSTTVGWMVIAFFLLLNGLLLWIIPGEFNIFDNGFADLSSFFIIAPWVLLLLIPAVTMRSFSEEKKMGTFELLITKPISLSNIVLGKYFGAVILICLAIVPTLLYIMTISKLGNSSSNWDVGSTIGSYIGLLFLIFAYTSIGIFASAISKNQIAAFISAVFLSLFIYYGFDTLTSLFQVSSIEINDFGMKTHFDSVARGVLDTRDVLYFLSVSTLFLIFTNINLRKD
ncbi:MAG: gliding motility-associated ABC transporter permease subunit GldF [Flavobacteriaceae bacterium]|jgi:ABC-2 type transport system permease protein|nr:gliding motility-associated ABC transporter permease subunit GldF [Flavobacteriaceae bacterium]